MRVISDPKFDFDDVLIVPKRSTLVSRSEVNLERTLKMKYSTEWTGIPIIAANMDTIGTFEVAKALASFKVCTAIHKHYDPNLLVEFFKQNQDIIEYVFYSLGISAADINKYHFVKDELGELKPKNICIDVANGYSETFVDFVKKFRDKNPNVRIMAGNVVTGEMTEQLILNGVDIVKVGIGPGSVCTTRRLTGIGYPQLSAIIECADAAHGLGGLICGDGGIKVPGDFGKAFGAGADFTMCGGIFAGHDECGGNVIIKTIRTDEVIQEKSPAGQIFQEYPVYESQKFMEFYGMSSDTAMKKYAGGVAEYRASEGKTVLVPYKGPIENTIKEVLGGLRSTCTYVGATRLKELSKRTTFIMVNRQLNNKFGD